jgi:ATP-binding cassette subfamily F protein 2
LPQKFAIDLVNAHDDDNTFISNLITLDFIMAPASASKQKRLAEKAAKQAVKQKGGSLDPSSTTTTPTGSVNGGSSAATPLTSLSAATSTDDLNAMEKLKLATERYVYIYSDYGYFTDRLHRSAAGVLASDAKGRDIKLDQYTLSFHGRLLIENAEVSLNYGQRYGLLGDNGSGKVRNLSIY